MDMNSSKKRFVSGVSALTLSALLVKVIGLLYKIPLLHVLGAEGMGYFNAAYEIYTLFFVISTAGLPVAVSVLIAESAAGGRLKNVSRIHSISFGIFVAVGAIGSLCMGFGARVFSHWLESERAYLSILAISPTVLFVCASGAIRGFFQGCQNMVPTAISQVIEALGKLLLGLSFALLAVKRGLSVETCAAFGVLGVTVGALISSLYLLIEKHVFRFVCPQEWVDFSLDPPKDIIKRLMWLAIPVTLSSSLSGVSRIVDMTMLLRRLQTVGFSADVATAMYGSYSTLAVPVYHLPASLVAGISVALVPTLAAAVEERNGEKASELIASSLRLCALVALPCGAGITVFSQPILSLLFAGEGAAIALAAPLLTALGLSVLSSCLAAVTNAVLHAYKKASLPIYSMLAGTAVKIVSAYFLIGIPKIGIMGAPISTLLCNLVSVGINFYYIDRETHFSASLAPVLVRPFFATLLSVGGALVLYGVLCRNTCPEEFAFILSLALCAIAYLFCSVAFGAFSEEDLGMLPSGEKVVSLLTKLKILKTYRKDKT